MDRERILILGAAGRDFHNFNAFFRDRPEYLIVGFTAAQIPEISCRVYPPELSGPLYAEGLPIWPEERLEEIVREQMIDRCILAYSDLSHQAVMSLASRVLAVGADFGFMGGWRTMLKSSRPVVAVCAVRTGAGKSQTSRYVIDAVRQSGLKIVAVRHPMPYGDLRSEAVQRFASFEEIDSADLTIEEREEYESHIKRGTVVYAGVDYGAILAQAESEADVILWDGGNNDMPFFRPDLWITVADALRPGQEMTYYPGESNFRAADVIVINKANSGKEEDLETIRKNALDVNPDAIVVKAASEVNAEDPGIIKGRRVLVIEDGPTITHGGMSYGAGYVAAEKYGAMEIIDPRAYTVGSLRDVYRNYTHIGRVLPAMGYYPEQIRELEETVNGADCDSVVIGTPVDLSRLMKMDKPSTRVTYELEDMDPPLLRSVVLDFVSKVASKVTSKTAAEVASRDSSRGSPIRPGHDGRHNGEEYE